MIVGTYEHKSKLYEEERIEERESEEERIKNTWWTMIEGL